MSAARIIDRRRARPQLAELDALIESVENIARHPTTWVADGRQLRRFDVSARPDAHEKQAEGLYYVPPRWDRRGYALCIGCENCERLAMSWNFLERKTVPQAAKSLRVLIESHGWYCRYQIRDGYAALVADCPDCCDIHVERLLESLADGVVC